MDVSKFWAAVAQLESDCWLWLGRLEGDGRGRFWHDGKDHSARHFAWEAVCCPVPTGMVVLRACDTHGCVRPDHLVLWAEWDVGGMARLRGTRPAGPAHGRSKMTEAKVLEARRRWAEGELASDLAKEYGLGHTPMDYLLSGKTWAHLPVMRRTVVGATRARKTASMRAQAARRAIW